MVFARDVFSAYVASGAITSIWKAMAVCDRRMVRDGDWILFSEILLPCARKKAMSTAPEMPLEILLTLLRIGKEQRCDVFEWMPRPNLETGERYEQRRVYSRDLCLVALPYLEAIAEW